MMHQLVINMKGPDEENQKFALRSMNTSSSNSAHTTYSEETQKMDQH